MTGTSYRSILRCVRPTVAWVRAFRDLRETDLPIAWSADLPKELTSPMSTLSEANSRHSAGTPTVAARAVDAAKIYGKDDNEVRALDGVTIDFATGAVHGDHGPVGLGQVDAHALLRRASTRSRRVRCAIGERAAQLA